MRHLRVTPQVLLDEREPTAPKGMLTPVLEEEEFEISQKDIKNIYVFHFGDICDVFTTSTGLGSWSFSHSTPRPTLLTGSTRV